MKKIIVILAVGLIATGCSSAPKVSATKPQYCHTSETIENKNGEKINSTTLVECTDDQIKRLFHSRSGMASNCGVFTYWTKVGGMNVQRKGISCQKPNGNWEVINTSPYQ